jgi:hypothetical protein
MVGASGGSFSSAYGPPRLTYPAPAACSGGSDAPILDALGSGALLAPPLAEVYATSEADALPFALDVADCAPAQQQLQQPAAFPASTQQLLHQPLGQQQHQAPLHSLLPKAPLVAGPPSPSGPLLV